MTKFILKIFKFIFTTFIAFLIFTCLFSLKSNMSFQSAITCFKAIGSEFLNIDNSKNNITDFNSQLTISSSNNHYFIF